jgi:hypothetical protein
MALSAFKHIFDFAKGGVPKAGDNIFRIIRRIIVNDNQFGRASRIL